MASSNRDRVSSPALSFLSISAAQAIGPANANERMTVTVKVRSKDDNAAVSDLEKLTGQAAQGAAARPPGRLRGDARRGPGEPEKGRGLRPVQESDRRGIQAARRCVVLSGEVSDFENAFGVKLERFRHAGGTFRSHATRGPGRRPICSRSIEAVHGLSNRSGAKPHFQYRQKRAPVRALTAAAAQPLGPPPGGPALRLPHRPRWLGPVHRDHRAGGRVQRSTTCKTYFEDLGIAEAASLGRVGPRGAPTPRATRRRWRGDARHRGRRGRRARARRSSVYFAPNTDAGFRRRRSPTRPCTTPSTSHR